MEPPGSNSPDGIRDEKVKVLQGDPPAGTRQPSSAASTAAIATEEGVAADSARSRPSRRCGWKSTRGDGPTCRS